MCNEAARIRSLGEISAEFNQLKIPLRFPEGLPNLGEAPSIRITDATVIVRASRDGIVRAATDDPATRAAEMVTRRWSWPGAGGGGSRAAAASGKPVYNFRSEGRTFADRAPGTSAGPGGGGGRCLIPLDGFYEFTAAEPGAKRKTKWLFTVGAGPFGGTGDGGDGDPAAARALFCVAGLWRTVRSADGAAFEAFTMLTCAPGPDIAPYHSRQIVLLPRASWADWLGIGARGGVAADALIAPTPAGTLRVERVG